jgi:regulator of RNase E activity RraA
LPTDRDLLDTLRTRLFTAVVGDVMDKAGLHRQFLPAAIRPLALDMIVAGRALPVLEADIDPLMADATDADDFGLMLRALDDLKDGEVYIATGGMTDYALWGGLMSTRAIKLGAAGAVLDGCHRDTREILALGFPTFSRGPYAQDQRGRGRVADFRVAVTFANGCRVAPGDIVFGDIDGVVVIPAASADEIVAAALAKVDGEDLVRRMIEAGESAEAAFAKTGIM